ncbi:hypothetical protein BLNAU_10751 [Blattamonas nauphoetae]|uniref:Uncharacterized protein n=1 Tax=Blattamonas nauphoetae TaxID=2049346 RepID=A0ABQ9XSP5_9EUKA|nr:hypothetical protein BLNAU_10751 [Blattamonas nauphoetae]
MDSPHRHRTPADASKPSTLVIPRHISSCQFMTILRRCFEIASASPSPPTPSHSTRRKTLPLLPNQTRPSSPFLANHSHVDDDLGRFGKTEKPKCFFMHISQFLFTLPLVLRCRTNLCATVVHHQCPFSVVDSPVLS